MNQNALTPDVSHRNYGAFLWHAVFLALAHSFMDVDTVLPVMMLEVGGSAFHVGLITAIMIGGPTFTQLFFSPFLNNKPIKKPYLLAGIGVRIASLFGMGLLYSQVNSVSTFLAITLIFLLLSAFSFGGAFAAISYTDILGKSMLPERRKSFFSIKQSITNVGVFASAYMVGRILTWLEYPFNYSWLFIIAGGSLAIASIGFLKIKEVKVDIHKVSGLMGFVHVLRDEIRSNKKLRYYILMVNTLGVSLSILPFIMMYVQKLKQEGSELVGQFLLLKVVAAVISGFIFFSLAKKVKYSYLMYGAAALGVALMLYLLLDIDGVWYGGLFLTGGVLITAYKVATDGVLMEVSSDHNRSLYAGIAGIANILPAFFPILGGAIVQLYGFGWLFAIITALLVLSILFIYRLDCQK